MAALNDLQDLERVDEMSDITAASDAGQSRSSSNKSKTSATKPKVKTVKVADGDIRREYALIFAKALNSGDRDVIWKCLQTYCVPDCVVTYRHIGIFPHGVDNMRILGVEAIAEFWVGLIESCPDLVIHNQETKFRVMNNGTCTCVMKYIFSGTKVLKLSTDESHKSVMYKAPDDTSSDQSNDSQKFMTSSFPKTDTTKDDDSNLSYRLSYRNLGPNKSTGETNEFQVGGSMEIPTKVVMVGTKKVFINKNSKIYKFEFVHSCVAQ